MHGEFELIERYFKLESRRADVVKGVGDDAALVRPPAGKELVITVDTLIEDVHFPAQTIPEAIGHKALAVNFSDLAAMGATPAWFMLSLTLPKPDERWLKGFTSGMFKLASRFDVELIGGDLTHGDLSVTIMAAGFTPPSAALRREGAQLGDHIYVTGCLGDAAMGLRALNNKLDLDIKDLEYCLDRLNFPTPRVGAGEILLNLATAAIDVSDGLAGDLSHILAASGVGAGIELALLPLSQTFQRAFGDRPDWRLPLAGGDDYELLFTVPDNKTRQLNEAFKTLDCDITRIGRIEPQGGLRIWTCDRRFFSLDQPGYNHFK